MSPHCWECGCDRDSAPLICACGVPVTCGLCDGDGCRHCAMTGWLTADQAQSEHGVEDADELDSWDWDNARHERAEAAANR